MSNPFQDYLNNAAQEIGIEMDLSEDDRPAVRSTGQHLAAQRSRILGANLNYAEQLADRAYLEQLDNLYGGNRTQKFDRIIQRGAEIERQVWGG